MSFTPPVIKRDGVYQGTLTGTLDLAGPEHLLVPTGDGSFSLATYTPKPAAGLSLFVKKLQTLANTRTLNVRLIGADATSGNYSYLSLFTKSLIHQFGRSQSKSFGFANNNTSPVNGWLAQYYQGAYGIRLNGTVAGGATPLIYTVPAGTQRVHIMYSTYTDGGSITVEVKSGSGAYVTQTAINCNGAASFGNISTYTIPSGSPASIRISPPATGTGYLEYFVYDRGDLGVSFFNTSTPGVSLSNLAGTVTKAAGGGMAATVAYTGNAGLVANFAPPFGYIAPDLVLYSGPPNDDSDYDFLQNLTNAVNLCVAANCPILLGIEPINAFIAGSPYSMGTWAKKRAAFFALQAQYPNYVYVYDWEKFLSPTLVFNSKFFSADVNNTVPGDYGSGDPHLAGGYDLAQKFGIVPKPAGLIVTSALATSYTASTPPFAPAPGSYWIDNSNPTKLIRKRFLGYIKDMPTPDAGVWACEDGSNLQNNYTLQQSLDYGSWTPGVNFLNHSCEIHSAVKALGINIQTDAPEASGFIGGQTYTFSYLAQSTAGDGLATTISFGSYPNYFVLNAATNKFEYVNGGYRLATSTEGSDVLYFDQAGDVRRASSTVVWPTAAEFAAAQASGVTGLTHLNWKFESNSNPVNLWDIKVELGASVTVGAADPKLSLTGGTLTGSLLTVASTATKSGFNIAPGVDPTTPVNGDIWASANGLNFRFNGTTQTLAPSANPTFTGTVSGVTSAMVGLGNVNNTSDINKPVSTAQQTAMNLLAPLASPTFTGTPLAPTAVQGSNTTQVATTAFTQNTVAKYVASRAENLVTNGSGLLFSNYNFSAFNFNSVDVVSGGGSFEITGTQTYASTDEFIPVTTSSRYRLSGSSRWTGGAQQPLVYIGLTCYDIDGNQIQPGSNMRQFDDTLAAPLKPGDTTIKVSSPGSWNNSAGASSHFRTYVIWGYKNSFGYTYPAYTYSRFYTYDSYADGGVNTSTGIITLRNPFPSAFGNPNDPQGIWPTGTPISNGSSGATYKYIAAGAASASQTWTRYSGVIQGVDLSGNNDGTKFSPGTAFVKVMFLPNQTTTIAQTTRYSNIEFALDLLGGPGSGLDSDTLDGQHAAYFAPVSSPTLTGIPAAPTAALNTNTTQLATTAFVKSQVANDAPTKTGGGASGTWPIAITGSAGGNAATATTLLTPRTISTSGDATWTTTFDGSVNVTAALTLATVATAGTYRSVTVNAKGLVTSGTNPTTLAGYGITDAVSSARQVIAGTGLTGGGALTADATITLGTPSTITTATTNSVTTTTHTHALTIAKADIGLGNVDNTSDVNKPVSTAQQTALNLKANLSSPSFTGTITSTGDIVPSANITYALGTPSMMWKDLYVGPGSIYVNGKKVLQDNSNTITLSTDLNQNLSIQTSGTGNIQITSSGTGAILMQGTVTVTSGKKILDSAGVKVEFGSNIDAGTNLVLSSAVPTLGNHLSNKSYVDSLTTGDSTIVRTTGTQTIVGAKSFTGDIVISGNLTISGTTTTVNSQTILLADNIVELNSDFTTGTPTENAGFQVRRGDLGYMSFLWDETNKRFTFIDNNSVLQPLYIGGLTATTANFTGLATFSGGTSGLTSAMVGLGNVNNTSDASKPISTATQTALNLLAPLASPTFTGTVSGITSAMVGLGNVDNTSDVNKPVSTAQQTALNLKAPLASPTFTGTVAGITAAMVGLGNVNNTSDASKPISTATQSALNLLAPLASPTFTGTVAGITAAMVGLGSVNNTADATKVVASAAAWTTARTISASGDAAWTVTADGSANVTAALTLATVVTAGTYRSVTVDAKGRVTAGTNPTTLAGYGITDAVSSTSTVTAGSGMTGGGLVTSSPSITLGTPSTLTGATANAVTATSHTHALSLTKTDVGLSNVDNTSDVNKPISTAQQAALNLLAPLASPTLTGVPAAPTAAVSTNTTQLATTAFVVAQLANSAPTKTGTGASGSWPISITGSAATTTGNALTATTLQTPRTIAISGAITGTATTFDGSANIAIPVTSLNLSDAAVTGTLAGGRLSSASGAYAIDPYIPKTNTPASNLSYYTLSNVAIEKAYIRNKLQFVLPITIEYTLDGTTWQTHPSAPTSLAIKQLFLGYNAGSSININGPNNGNWQGVRMVFDSPTYVYLDYLYFYGSTNGHTGTLKIEKTYGADLNTFSTVATGNFSGWPSHVATPHDYIAWNPTPTPGSHSRYVRITFTPIWNGTYPSNNISINNINWYGGYPANAQPELFTWDFDKNVTFPNTLTAGVNRVLDAGNYNTYSPTLSGTGASGTWGISVTGSALTLATARTLSATGDATWTTTFDGSANVTAALTLASVATAGTYRSVTVDSKGRVTAGTNPTTLAGYGITDAALSARQVIAGNGLSGGGDLTADRTFALGTPSTLTGATTNAVTATSHTHAVTITQSDVGLGNVNNTSDANKPISTAQQSALNQKLNLSGGTITGNLVYQVTTSNGHSYSLTGNVGGWSRGSTYTNTAGTITSGFGMNGTNETTSAFYVGFGPNWWSADQVMSVAPGGVVTATTFVGALNGNASTATKIASPATISITGDATYTVSFDGSANVTSALTFATTGVTAGTYKSVTVNAKGLVTGGTNPTTLAGYGITDAAPSSHIGSGGTAHANATGTVAGFMSSTDKAKLDGIAAGANSGTVTSVALSLPSMFTVTGSPVTTTGTLTATLATQSANTVMASPDGAAGAPTFRTLVVGDVPILNQNTTGNSGSATKLQTIRTINGVNFDGTANITVADATKEPIITAGTTAQYYRGDKTWVTLDKVAVGLANIDNTSDVNKPVSTAQQTALNAKANTATTLAGYGITDAPTVTGTGATGTWNISVNGGTISGTTGAFSGVVTSTLATGTAPFTVASTTKVTNLNVDLLKGADWASPLALGSTTAAAVSSTNLAYTGTLSGGTGAITIGTNQFYKDTSGNIGIGTTTPGYKLQVNGSFAAVTKSFVIDHPSKPNMKLRYGSLEGPENGVYVRGRLNGTNKIQLPDYWSSLVDIDTITVNLTAVGKAQNLYVTEITDTYIMVKSTSATKAINAFYTVFAERKDVDKLIVEIQQ